jgi:hypothetical protein
MSSYGYQCLTIVIVCRCFPGCSTQVSLHYFFMFAFISVRPQLILTPHSSPCYCEVGYLNYRYFVNFLLYVCIGMLYGALLSVRSFLSMSFRPKAVSAVWRPERGDETAVAFSFMLCLSVGLAVACLGGFHLYLLLTAQTTIEFHGE